MEDREILLAHGSERDPGFVSEYVDSLDPQALPLLSGSLWVEREHDRDEILVSLLYPEERAESLSHLLTAAARAFLAQYVPPTVLEVFPEWQGILIEFPALEGDIWVVPDLQHGQQLACDTGQPAILLAALLTQQGRTLEETREALAPFLILPRGKTAQRKPRRTEQEGIQKT
jgi:hypothetical protein